LTPTARVRLQRPSARRCANTACPQWFFNAFGPILQPNICILLDVGTRPEAKSIYHLWKCFDLCSSVAGAAGEIQADTRGKWGLGPALLNPLVACVPQKVAVSNQC